MLISIEFVTVLRIIISFAFPDALPFHISSNFSFHFSVLPFLAFQVFGVDQRAVFSVLTRPSTCFISCNAVQYGTLALEHIYDGQEPSDIRPPQLTFSTVPQRSMYLFIKISYCRRLRRCDRREVPLLSVREY